MRNKFDSQLEKLNLELITMGALCEDAISASVKGFLDDDDALCQKVVETEDEINRKERDIESICMKLLLEQQPVARDLRVISSALKMISDMERIGDFAADIAEIVTKGGRTGTGYHIELIDRMGRAVIRMVDEAVLSFTNSDLELAKKVCKSDDEVDNLFNGAKNVLLDCIRNDEKLAERALDLMLVSKYLERIGDHATNIAEWVIFSITGVHVNTENG